MIPASFGPARVIALFLLIKINVFLMFFRILSIMQAERFAEWDQGEFHPKPQSPLIGRVLDVTANFAFLVIVGGIFGPRRFRVRRRIQCL